MEMGTIAYIDHLLRNPGQVILDMKDDAKVGKVTGAGFKVFIILSVIYGLIMGSQSLFHGHWHGWMYSVAAAIKLPVLFLLTAAICMPLVYVLNVLIGAREEFKVIFGLLMSSLAVTSILLAACALILAFFMLTTKSYAFIKLLNVVIFTVAGLYGVWYLSRGMHWIAARNAASDQSQGSRPSVSTIVTWWLITYAIVGTQMAWMMRPFIGHPGTPFSIFRAQESNFYVEVANSIYKMLSGG
jgi:hypothetical protein